MEARSISRFNRISVRKLCRITKLVSGMNYKKAVFVLSGLSHKGSGIVLSTLKSAKANLGVKIGEGFSEESCKIKELIVNRGAYLKRLKYRARGKADRLYCPSTHLIVTVFEKRGKG